MTHASLFSGIGGAELAAEWMGWKNLFHCEIQEFPRRVLEYWYPKSKSYEDITKTKFTEWRGKVDVLTGGFPCQPFSLAGRRLGAEDDRYLWPHMLRAIREIQPSWVVGENVAGILTMVQPGEEIKMGRTDDIFDENYIYREERRFTLDEICEGLEREGYSVQPFVIPACAVGAPHRRDRVWIVAHRDGAGFQETRPEQQAARSARGRSGRASANANIDRLRERAYQQVYVSQREGTTDNSDGRQDGAAADPHSKLSQCGDYSEQEGRDIKRKRVEPPRSPTGWAYFPTQSPVCRGDDGLSARLAGISFPRWRSESIKALGNAWVPQVAYEIFQAIAKEEGEDVGKV